ncbi:MAG: class I SAM-dependent methyltransferase [Myxococcota bacterium]
MRLVHTRFLDDGLGLWNHGQPATLVEMEKEEDYDVLLRNIVESSYYDRAYFESHSGYREPSFLQRASALRPWTVLGNLRFLAQMAGLLQPRRALEVGCGRGDVLALLLRNDVEVCGIDFSDAVQRQLWPEVRPHFIAGDFGPVCDRLASGGERFDLILGFDIWEHLHPKSLHPHIESVLKTTSDDALLLLVIPAFGDDRIFGSQFPLEFEENRRSFEERGVFRFLCVEKTEPLIPAAGHLIWAHAQWWERQFTSHGLFRAEELECALHAIFDDFLPHSNRSFFLFGRDTGAGRRRVAELKTGGLSPSSSVRVLMRLLPAARRLRQGAGRVKEAARAVLPPRAWATLRSARLASERVARSRFRP